MYLPRTKSTSTPSKTNDPFKNTQSCLCDPEFHYNRPQLIHKNRNMRFNNKRKSMKWRWPGPSLWSGLSSWLSYPNQGRARTLCLCSSQQHLTKPHGSGESGGKGGKHMKTLGENHRIDFLISKKCPASTCSLTSSGTSASTVS